MILCKKCRKALSGDDIGAHRKFINRLDDEFFCLDCLAERICTTKALLEKKIAHFKKLGCSMF